MKSIFEMMNDEVYKDYVAIDDALQEVRRLVVSYTGTVDPFELDDNKRMAGVLKHRAAIATAVKKLNDILN